MYIRTFSGHEFSYDNLAGNVIDIKDIAHSLANTCRYNGHCPKFYSVAEHSVLAAELCQDYPREALMHDAAEAYLGDVVTPFKNYLGEYFHKLESAVETMIAKRFGLRYPMPQEVKDVDRALLVTEYQKFFKRTDVNGPTVSVEIKCLSPEEAEKLFLETWEKFQIPRVYNVRMEDL